MRRFQRERLALPQKGDLIFDERKIVFNKTPVGKVRLYMTKQYINDNMIALNEVSLI